MSRSLLRTVLPPLVLNLLRHGYGRIQLAAYRRNPIPWSPGYNLAKHKLLRRLINDSTVLELFRSGNTLPPGYGMGIDERCVEYPWLLSHLTRDEGTLLDAGSALNFPHILHHPTIATKAKYIMTLAPEASCFWNEAISYNYGDLRYAPFRDSFFDTIVCISTLEHIGCDNSDFAQMRSIRPFDPQEMMHALGEMWRMLKCGGTLFVTVPFGERQDYVKFQQFDRKLLDLVVGACNGALRTEWFYQYEHGGWQLSTDDACSECKYADDFWNNHISSDGAAAARAVACIMLEKQKS